MIETYRFRIYPTDEQKVLLSKHFGCVRFMYNWALRLNQERYASQQKYLNSIGLNCSGETVKLKEANPWLYEVNSQSLICAVGHLDRAFNNFFAGRANFPKFKSKKFDKDSFEIPQHFQIDFKESKIKIPKFSRKNGIKVKISRRVKKGKIGIATISKNSSGQYYVSFIVHTKHEPKKMIDDAKISYENSLGIDFGLKTFMTFSNGDSIVSPQYFKKMLDKLAWEQRKLSKKQKGSKNKEKQRKKVAKIYQKITDQRKDFLHKTSTELVKDSQFACFCIEDLNLQGMKKLWGRKVSDLGWNMFTSMLSYKAMREGKIFKKIGRFEASSQICHHCGHRQKMPLDVRVYKCQKCGIIINRDLNAAINIRNFALRDIFKNTDGTSGINACGVGSAGMHDASYACETADSEARKSSECQGMEEHLKITSFKM